MFFPLQIPSQTIMWGGVGCVEDPPAPVATTAARKDWVALLFSLYSVLFIVYSQLKVDSFKFQLA